MVWQLRCVGPALACEPVGGLDDGVGGLQCLLQGHLLMLATDYLPGGTLKVALKNSGNHGQLKWHAR